MINYAYSTAILNINSMFLRIFTNWTERDICRGHFNAYVSIIVFREFLDLDFKTYINRTYQKLPCDILKFYLEREKKLEAYYIEENKYEKGAW